MDSSASSPRRTIGAALLIAAASVAGGGAQQVVRIDGAGATFPNPIYSRWFAEYHKLHPDIQINYQAIGSGGGVRQIEARTVFFGASDMPLTPRQMQALPGRVLHVPTVLGAVVPVYNIPGVRADLRFSGPVLADIFLGKVTRWNDAAIARLNPDVSLPPADIVVAHRADGSGTTYIWADYLSKVSSEWQSTVGVGPSVSWPTGVGGRGNEGVAALVSQVPGAIGYVELVYATHNRMTYGLVRNAAGMFVKGSVESVSAAAMEAVEQLPDDFRLSMTNAPGSGSYPISSFTWLLVYETSADTVRSRAMTDFIRWALTAGQKYCVELGYAPLPDAVVKLEMAALARVKTS